MPRPKAHWMGDVRLTDQGGDYATVYVTVRDVDDDRQPIGSEYELELMELNDGDAYKACAAVGINPKESRFMGADGRVKRLADVRRVLVVEGVATWAPKNAGAAAWRKTTATETTATETTIIESTQDEKPVEPPKPSNESPFGALESWIRDVAGKAMDEDQVRAIVSDAMKDIAPWVTEITIPDRFAVVELEGKQHEAFPKVLRYCHLRKNVWLSGPAGTGKSTIARHVATALDLPFYSMSCDPTMQRATLFGFMGPHGQYVETDFYKAYANGGVFLLDEIDKGSPGVIAGLNQAIENGHAGFPCGGTPRHANFVFIGTANTWGTGATDQYIGSLKLDAATLNRFRKVHVGIDEAMEEAAVRGYLADRVQADTWLSMVRKARENVAKHNLRVLVTPRDAIEGASLIAQGFTMEECANDSWLAGLNADDLAKVNA